MNLLLICCYDRQCLAGGIVGQDTFQVDTFWGVLNVSHRASCAQLGGAPAGLLWSKKRDVTHMGLFWSKRHDVTHGGPN